MLQDNEQVEQYVLNVVRDYFRCTNKAGVTLDAPFQDHNIDSLDIVELVIQIEDELGYVVEPENLEKFSKPRHLVNYILQYEAYRKEFSRLPHEDTHAHFRVEEVFPGLESIFGSSKKK